MKKILLFLAFVLLVGSAKAQIKFHVGLTTAINSTFVLDQGLKADPRYLSTATFKFAPIGVQTGIHLGKRFGLNLEAIRAAQGQVYQVIDAYDKIVGERNFDMTYLQFPLLMQFMSGGDGMARFNFQLGPQISVLQTGVEVIKYIQSGQDLTMLLPDGVPIPQGSTDNGDGTYTFDEIPDDRIVMATDDIDISGQIPEEVFEFQNQEIQLAMSVGLDLDLSKNLYLTTIIRANYSFTDMRGDDLIEIVKSGNVSELFDQRANLAVGMQIGLHWMFGGTRHFSVKE